MRTVSTSSSRQARGSVAVLDPFRDCVIGLAQHDFHVKFHRHSPIRPPRDALLEKGRDAFRRVVGLHQIASSIAAPVRGERRARAAAGRAGPPWPHTGAPRADFPCRCASNQRSTSAARVAVRDDRLRPARSAPRRPRAAVSRSRSRCVARAVPTRGGSSADAAGGNTPSATSGSPKVADSSAKMKSHASAISKPPPRHRPRTSAAVTIGRSSSA